MNDTVTINHPAPSRNIAPWTFEELLADTATLKALLVEETRALRTMNVQAVQAFHETKLRLIRKLEIQKELVARNPAMLEGLTENQKHRLREIGNGMDQVMKENFHEVLKVREVNQCVVRAISREVRKYENRATGYTRQGIAANGIHNYDGKASGPSVALNQMI